MMMLIGVRVWPLICVKEPSELLFEGGHVQLELRLGILQNQSNKLVIKHAQ